MQTEQSWGFLTPIFKCRQFLGLRPYKPFIRGLIPWTHGAYQGLNFYLIFYFSTPRPLLKGSRFRACHIVAPRTLDQTPPMQTVSSNYTRSYGSTVKPEVILTPDMAKHLVY